MVAIGIIATNTYPSQGRTFFPSKSNLGFTTEKAIMKIKEGDIKIYKKIFIYTKKRSKKC